MPVVQTTAYSSVETALNLARALVNDMMVNQGGEILTDNAPFTFIMLNEAADYLQKELENHGMMTFVRETTIGALPVAHFTADPSFNVNLSDSGFFDGYQNFNPPQLPADVLEPISLWEKQTNSTENWIPMQRLFNAGPYCVPRPRYGTWGWFNDSIYMPGALQINDLKLRYTMQSNTFIAPTDFIQIRGATSALGNLLAAVFANSRGSPAAIGFSAAADKFIEQICTANARSKQQVTVTRQSYGSSARGRRY